MKGFAADSPNADIQQLQESLARQEALIETQQKVLDEQQKKLAEQEKEIKEHRAKLATLAQATPAAATPAPTAAKVVAQTPALAPEAASAPAAPITSPPKEEEARPQVNVLPDYGGILTPKGVLMYENSLEYTNTTTNVFAFDGVQIAQVLFVGTPTAATAERQIVQDTSRFRLGITNRLEADVRVPYVYRNDATTYTPFGGTATSTTLNGNDIGDVDAGLSYQINKGQNGWPFLIGNLRYKSDTGTGPYDVKYDSNNIATSLPTGTGFNSVDGSMTIIKVTDPAVLFANFGYVYSIGGSIDKNFNTIRVLDVKPGGVVNASTGMGFSINQDTSFTLGYKHSFVMPTFQTSETFDPSTGVISGPVTKTHSNTENVGVLLVGLSYRLSPFTSINFNTEVGATRDAPDLHIGLRVPIELGHIF
jgi:uncharacterized coiled-coil protein SlyX